MSNEIGARVRFGDAFLTLPPATAKAQRPRADRPSLPAHLPREELRLDLEHQVCPCCGGELHVIGETVSEMLDHVPARLRVIRICRPRYGCRTCGTIQAPAPERPIAKAWPVPPCSPTSWSPSTATTFRFTGRARSSPAKASSWIARPWRTGSEAPAGGWSRYSKNSPSTSSPRKTVRRRHPDPGARSRPRPHQDRPALGLCPRYRPWSGAPAAIYLYSPDRRAIRFQSSRAGRARPPSRAECSCRTSLAWENTTGLRRIAAYMLSPILLTFFPANYFSLYENRATNTSGKPRCCREMDPSIGRLLASDDQRFGHCDSQVRSRGTAGRDL